MDVHSYILFKAIITHVNKIGVGVIQCQVPCVFKGDMLYYLAWSMEPFIAAWNLL